MNIDELAESIQKAILADVTDRRGWRQEYDQFDGDIKKEIKNKWIKIIKKQLNADILNATPPNAP